MCMGVLAALVCVHHMHPGAHRGRRPALDSLELGLQTGGSCPVSTQTAAQVLCEQPVLLTSRPLLKGFFF